MRRAFSGALAAAWIALTAASLGCGEGMGAEEDGPVIGLVDVMCAESTSEGFDGEVVNRIEVPIAAAEDGAALGRVTATVQGAVLTMREDPERPGVYVYTQSPDSESFIRCEAGLTVIIRATDRAGNVDEKEVKVR